jgi:hypothetical protein
MVGTISPLCVLPAAYPYRRPRYEPTSSGRGVAHGLLLQATCTLQAILTRAGRKSTKD